jgi:hypothetical protein
MQGTPLLPPPKPWGCLCVCTSVCVSVRRGKKHHRYSVCQCFICPSKTKATSSECHVTALHYALPSSTTSRGRIGGNQFGEGIPRGWRQRPFTPFKNTNNITSAAPSVAPRLEVLGLYSKEESTPSLPNLSLWAKSQPLLNPPQEEVRWRETLQAEAPGLW